MNQSAPLSEAIDAGSSGDPLALVLSAHAGATWLMVGLIWFVQIVHYPLFRDVPPEARGRYFRRHQARTTLIVGPAMLVEALTTGVILLVAIGVLDLGPLDDDAGVSVPSAVLGAALLSVVWLSTFLVQVPMHTRLLGTSDNRLLGRLVWTNWVRTLAWTARGIVALAMI